MTINLNGWDTVSALSVDAVNRALTESTDRLITDFEMSGSRCPRGSSSAASSGRGARSRRSGNILRLAVPIASGSIRPTDGAAVDLAGATALVDVSLELLPTAEGRNLVLALHKAGQVGDPARPGVVTPVRLDVPPVTKEGLGAVGARLVLDGVVDILTTKAATVSFVFASLNLVSSDSGGWLSPVLSAFRYLETMDGRGHLCVLSVTRRRDIQKLPHTVDPDLLAGSGDLAFAVSEELFQTGLVVPALPEVFGGAANAGCFRYDRGKNRVSATRAFSVRSIKRGAIRYTPRVTSLDLKVVGDRIELTVNGNCDLKAGITMRWWVTSRFSTSFDKAGQRLHFSAGSNTRSGHEVHIPWWFAIGGLLVTDITEFAASMISDRMTGTLRSRLGSTGLGSLAGRSVRWPGMDDVRVTEAELDEALLIHGTTA
jgi:hypothetical protein